MTDTLQDAPDSVQRMFQKLFLDFDRENKKREEENAKANPHAFRRSTVMKDTRFHYYHLPGKRKGYYHAFCYTQFKNVAGYYLTWTETWGGKLGRRTGWQAWKTKREAMDYCLERWKDGKKPKAMRKYVLPPYTQGQRHAKVSKS